MKQQELKALLHYEPATGAWTWLVTRSRVAIAGDPAGTINAHGYRIINIGGRLHRAHRLVFLYMTGAWPAELVDHKNGTRDDNRWANLREATLKQNSASAARPVNNTSGFKGVYFSKHAKRWRAQISIDRRTKNLGYFDTPEAAHRAYLAAAVEQFGEFARAA